MKSVLKWAAVALLVLVVLIVAREPQHWLGYLPAPFRTRGSVWPYAPLERVSGGNQPAAPREPPASESLEPAALQAAADYAAAHGSRALIVSRHGYLVFERYWQGSSFETVIDSQGLGRVVAALAAGIAISDRKIGWPDEPISYLIPALAHDPRGAITVRNLLQLSSGLGGSASDGYRTDVPKYLQLPLVAPPGTRWLDQSADPDLLAYVIHKATGRSYADYVSHAIWARIGAADAWIWLDRPGGEAHVDRGFLTHQGDWIRVAELLLRNGNYQGSEVVVPRWVPQMLEPAKSNSGYGEYIRLGAHAPPGTTPYAADDVFLVEGGGNRLWFIPSLQIAILRTGSGLDADWDDGRIPNLIIRGTRDFLPPAARPGADLRQLVPNH